MNTILRYGIILATLAVALTSCQNSELDTPPLKNLDDNAVLTITNLRELCPVGKTHTFVGDTSVFAVVIMDESTGNIYKQLYVHDGSQGVELRLSATVSSSIFQGDSVRVNLKGATISYYNSQFQVSDLSADNIIAQASGYDKEPVTVTIPELLSDVFPTVYQTRLVRIENVQFLDTELGKTYADAVNQVSENRYLRTTGDTIVVRTSGFADFANTKLPEGSGTIIAVATQYGETRQLVVRRPSEVELTEERF